DRRLQTRRNAHREIHGGVVMNGPNDPKLDLQALFSRAQAGGTLSPATSTLLSGNLGALVIAGAAGMAADDIRASDVTLITLAIAVSSCSASRSLEQAVCGGQRLLLGSFAG